jgi:hypothetical protein
MSLARLLVTVAGNHRAPLSGAIPDDDCPGPEDAQPTDREQAGRRLIPAASGEERRRDRGAGSTPRFLPVPPAGLEPAHPAPEAGALSSELRGRAERV